MDVNLKRINKKLNKIDTEKRNFRRRKNIFHFTYADRNILNAMRSCPQRQKSEQKSTKIWINWR